MDHFILTIVKAKAVPGRMFMPAARVKILIRVARKVAKPFYFILNGMRMHQVHNHGNAHLMSRIHKRLQLFWCSKPAGWGEKGADMIPKASVIRMLLYRHYLYGVIACRCNARKNIIPKLGICANLFGILRHTHMTFIYKQRVFLRCESSAFSTVFGSNITILPLVFFFRSPYLSRKNLCHFILNNTCCPCRNAFSTATFPLYMHFIQIAMRY